MAIGDDSASAPRWLIPATRLAQTAACRSTFTGYPWPADVRTVLVPETDLRPVEPNLGAVPLRAKPGQCTITCVVGGDPTAIAAGRKRAREMARYYGGAATAATIATPAPDPICGVHGDARPGASAGDASGRARDYFGEGATVGAGGRWCMALREGVVRLPEATCDQLEALGIVPQVQKWNEERLEALLLGAGRRGHGWAVDPATGQRVPAVRTHAWTFDLPKSMSLLSLYGQDDWLLETCEVAARVAMDILVSTSLLVRRRQGQEIVHERAQGLHYSMVLERTARGAVTARVPGLKDVSGLRAPHYHAHLLLHFAVNSDGQLCAPDVDDALQAGWRRLASAIADARVIAEAQRRGIALRPRPPETAGASWSWEVSTIPDAAVDAASERHRVIAAARAGSAAGPTGDLAAERLTKAAKEHDTDTAALAAHWKAMIEAKGARDPFGSGNGGLHGGDRGAPGGSSSAAGLLDDPRLTLSPEEAALAATFATASTARWQWVASDLLLRGAALREGEELWRWITTTPRRLEESGVLVPLRDGSLTTRAILDEEERIVRQWRAVADAGATKDHRSQLGRALRAHHRATGRELDEGQHRLVGRALTAGATIGVGVAGSGKTAAVRVLSDAMHAVGHRVHLVSQASLRARESRLDAEADSDQSVAAVTRSIAMGTFGERFLRGDTLVIDEAAQLGDAALDRITGACAEHGVRLVLLGDPKQQGPIERGGMFAELVRQATAENRPELVELTQAHRFRDAEMAEALAMYRGGDGAPLVAYLQRSGGLVKTTSADDSLRQMVDAWSEDRSRLIITCGSNARRDEIGAACVARLVASGEVSPRAVEVQADVDDPRRVAIHVGQKVRIQRQVRDQETGRPVARNGEVAVLNDVAVGEDGAPRVYLRFADRELVMPAADVVATHAYAMQSYKAQGSTTDVALVDWADGVDLQRAYPALSRQRKELRVYIAPVEGAFDDGAPPSSVDRVAAAAKRDHTPRAAIAIGEATAPSEELHALTAVPALTRAPATVEAAHESVDELRVALAAAGRLDARTLTLGELTVAMRDAQEHARRRLLEGELIGVRRWDAGTDGATQRRPVPAWVERMSREPAPSPLHIEVVASEPPVPWQPSPRQRPLLLVAQDAWPAVEDRKTEVLRTALLLEDIVTPGRARDLLDIYRADLDAAWQMTGATVTTCGNAG